MTIMTPKEAFQDAWKKIKQARAIYLKASEDVVFNKDKAASDVSRVFEGRTK